MKFFEMDFECSERENLYAGVDFLKPKNRINNNNHSQTNHQDFIQI